MENHKWVKLHILQCFRLGDCVPDEVALNSLCKKVLILQPIRIIAIKSRQTKAVIYTCRYSSGQFNPKFSALAEL